MGEDVGQHGATDTTLWYPFLADRPLARLQHPGLEHPVQVTQQARIPDLLPQHHFQQRVTNAVEIAG